ncbi:MAG: TIGR02301 family protein [Pseudomonadota bacterium]
MSIGPKIVLRAIAIVLGLGLGFMAVDAQSQETAEEAAPAVAPDALIAPYEDELLRLSEILGAVHFLRTLCKFEDGPLWRERMQALIEAEDASGIRRDQLTAQFNRGYETFSTSYRTCTQNATAALDHFLTEGVKLTETLNTRFGS